jgi:trehalose/maltose transport system substrate-binding protein
MPDSTAKTEALTTIQAQEIQKSLRTDLRGAKLTAMFADDDDNINWVKTAAAKFEEATGIMVTVRRGHDNPTIRLATYTEELSKGASDVDVYQIDMIWPAILAEFAENLTKPVGGLDKEFFGTLVDSSIITETGTTKTVGIPWFVDVGLLYYRRDLLAKYKINNPPETWTELEQQAKKIQDGERAAGDKEFWGFVWQGKAYEGLTCNALEWQFSYNGGMIVTPGNRPDVNNDRAIKAFERARSWIGTISPPEVINYKEEEARTIWQAGNAAFMRNWPYAYSLGQKDEADKDKKDESIKDKFDVTVLPGEGSQGGQHAAALGGQQLMVNKNSKSKDAAIEFVKFLTSPDVQRANALDNSRAPTRPDLYDAVVLEKHPFLGHVKDALASSSANAAVARPSKVTGRLYNDVSTAYFTSIHKILTGQEDAKTAIAELEQNLDYLLK